MKKIKKITKTPFFYCPKCKKYPLVIFSDSRELVKKRWIQGGYATYDRVEDMIYFEYKERCFKCNTTLKVKKLKI